MSKDWEGSYGPVEEAGEAGSQGPFRLRRREGRNVEKCRASECWRDVCVWRGEVVFELSYADGWEVGNSLIKFLEQ